MAAPPAPNLMVLAGNLKFDPSAPAQGEPVTITVTILNGGNADASDVVVQLLDVTGGGARAIGAEQIIDELPAGGNATVQVSFDNTDQPGDRTIQVTADPNDAVHESDEGDNRATKVLTISPPKIPNLVVRSNDIVYSPAKIVAGDEVQITATVRNDGNVDAGNVVVQIVDATNGGIELIGDPVTLDRIPAGGSSDVVVTYDTTDREGERRIRVTADPDDVIFETDEADNEAVKVLRVASEAEEPPDLPNVVIFTGNIKFEPSSPTAGEPVTMTVNVLNQGTVAAEDVLIRVMDVTDGASEVLGEQTITGTLDVGDGIEISMTLSTEDRAGTRTIQVTADPDGAIEESNEDDNQATKTLTIRAASGSGTVDNQTVVSGQSTVAGNLTVAIESITADTLGANDMLLTVAATVLNEGGAPVADLLVQFTDEAGAAMQRGLQRLPEVQSGRATAVSYSFVLPGGGALATSQLAVTVDPYDTVAEADEEDNVAAVEVDVAALLEDAGVAVAVEK
ncbi:MAG: CARDB domain-containing protein [Caldilineaceae bacterium]